MTADHKNVQGDLFGSQVTTGQPSKEFGRIDSLDPNRLTPENFIWFCLRIHEKEGRNFSNLRVHYGQKPATFYGRDWQAVGGPKPMTPLEKMTDSKYLQPLKELIPRLAESGIRVVQSGVENKELFDQSCRAGCDLIQGYYFARAISLEEYRIFKNSNTSIRYKAVVK